jgi:hypothetical protein
VLPPDPVEPFVAAVRPTSLDDMERFERCLLAGQRPKAPRKVDLGFDQPMTKIVRQAAPGETRGGGQAVGPLIHRGDADRLGISDGHDRPTHALKLSTVHQRAHSITRGNRRQAHDGGGDSGHALGLRIWGACLVILDARPRCRASCVARPLLRVGLIRRVHSRRRRSRKGCSAGSEDWAENFAHCLHMLDLTQTAAQFNIGQNVHGDGPGSESSGGNRCHPT